MIKKINGQIIRNTNSIYDCHLLDIFSNVKSIIWTYICKEYNLNMEEVKNGKLEYLFIDNIGDSTNMGYIKGNFSIVKINNKIKIYEFINDDYIVEKNQ